MEISSMKSTRRKTRLAIPIILLLLASSMISTVGSVKIIDAVSSEGANSQTPDNDVINNDIKLIRDDNEISTENLTHRFFPIYIKGNDALKGLRGRLHGVVSGRGTADDPYVISGWEPQWREIWKHFGRSTAIHLEGIDKHVVIKNNYIHGWNLYDPGRYPYGRGILIESCRNITVENNLVTNNVVGLTTARSSDCIIRFNTITENAVGFTCGTDSNISAINNSIFYNTDCGIICNNACSYIAFNQVFSNGEYGIRSISDDQSLFENNEIYNNWDGGVAIGSVSHTVLVNNQIFSNKKWGISCWEPTEAIIKNNSIYSNQGYGIYCYDSNPTIIDNIIDSNGGIGVEIIGDSPPSTISHNTISNQQIGIHIAFSNWDITYNIITENTNRGISVGDCQPQVHWNNLNKNTMALYNNGWLGVRVNASENWWGAPDGPSGNGTGSGDPISSWVDYIPWLYEPNPFAGPR